MSDRPCLSRVLPPDEWSRLADTDLGPIWRALDPSLVRVMVVEDADGALVGCWALMPFIHAEGLWIAPSHRARGTVLRRLWAEMLRAGTELGLQSVVTASIDPVVTTMLERRGAKTMPGISFVLPLDPQPRAADRALGETFHQQLFEQLPAAAHHADDRAHDAAVGRAIRVGVFEGDPQRAERQYNAWAVGHGYAPVRFLERRADGSVLVDIVEAVIAMSPDGAVTIVDNRLEVNACQP